MGNCIGKKSDAHNKHRRHTSSTVSTSKLHCNNQLNLTPTLPSSTSERTTDHLSSLSDVKESDILFNNKDESEKNIIQYSSSLATITNDQFLFSHSSSTLSPVQLSIQCKKFKSNNNVTDFSENNVAHPITLIKNEQDTNMGHLFSKEKEICDNKEVLIFTQEIISESVGTSPSPTLSDSSLSSFSSNTTSFSSQDQLILSSSCSSTELNPILSSYQLTNHNRFQFSPYNEQSYFDNQSTNEIFSTVLPVSFPRCKNDLFLNEFHKNTISHNCKTLSYVIDDVVQQEFIRIHRRTKTVLIEHKQLDCINLKDLKNLDAPSLIFDEDKKLVYITKYMHWNELKSITYNTKDVPCTLSSCDHCSLLLSGSKLNNRLHPFLLVNATYNLVQMCFNKINNNNIFGYISQKHANLIRQTIINSSKLNYSYDLDVNHTSFYFVLHIQSWPQEIRSVYEQRKRLWPLNIENLFNNTCFIRFKGNEQEISTNDKCLTCEKILLSSSNASWSYTYSAIEAQLVHTMSDGHLRFASILWKYLNGKTQGQCPFVIFKHTLFYFLEQYTSDSFITSDLFSHVHHFIDYLLNRLETKSIPHYFNSNYNLYNENISMTIMNLISIKMTYLDLKNFSIYILPKSSLYLYHLIYLIQFQMNFLQYHRSSKTNLTQTIIDTHEHAIQQLSYGVRIYKQQLDSTIAIKSHCSLTLDCLYQYQEENVQIILDYLPLLREKEPSLLIHSLWSIFIQYFNSLFDDLFIS
ncbi:unnamed protein product [Rotaria sp. Silwood1]|nr:unnamed protein product [Rotaria sp. Silwood1]CAF3395639.1 unnamed protein product [Rotaria sp. Silwood1]CAF3407104.1 unnamed protein product [Rotaria sp. Silwood1]CAF3407197.1 unnamed protein product [Rotaria sp. Silwood1]CAF4489864.1 unnamed protein product [Rotaria sp. Silwood1]